MNLPAASTFNYDRDTLSLQSPSGNGAGELELSTTTGLIRIHYQKPIRQDFLKATCREVGAIWTVQTGGRGVLGEDELVRAHCDGKVDAAVHGAWIGARLR